MATLHLDDVDLTYADGHHALRGVDLAVADGEFVALVGPSGSGKTTLLRTIAGFLAPQSGTVRIGGRTVQGPRVHVPPEGRRLGMVFQSHAIWPHWDVAGNVGYPLRLARVPRAEAARRVEATLELVGLAGTGRRDPATLSGGQRQRVALARALVTSPDALLLDEALASLDEPLRDSLRLELKALTARAGLTVVHVTHDRSEALALADRVVVMRDGAIEQVGPPHEVVERPATPFVARFLSDATLVDGTLDGGMFRPDDGDPVPVGAVELVGAGADLAKPGPGTLAVLPAGVALEPARVPAPVGAGAGAPTAAGADAAERPGTATVTSALYGPHGYDVVADRNGTPWRARLTGRRPQLGEAVHVRVERAIFYPR